MTVEEFFAEAKRLNLRMLGTPEEVRAALDAKDAEIQRLRVDLENTRADAVLAVATERERCASAVREVAEGYRATAWGKAAECIGDACIAAIRGA